MMSKLQKKFEFLNEFFIIKQDGNEIFRVLNKLVDFNGACIYFTNPFQILYSKNLDNIENIISPFLKEDLVFKNSIFGGIVITGEKFSEDDKLIFKTCASIISNITKDIEISKIIKLQIKALQESNEKIRAAEKIKTEFISHISHELRTPLNSILGFSDLLKQEFAGPLNEKQKEYTADIQTAAVHLLGMINEVLDMSKIESNAINLTLREFDIKPAVNEVLNILKPLSDKKNLYIKTDIKDILLKADYQKFHQILFNIIGNAIKFTPEKGFININVQKKSGNAIIVIEDSGIGIEKENLEKIFDKFVQFAPNNETSTGLGLTITKQLIKLHNGKIYVKSEVKKGTKFIVELPC